MGTRLRTHAKNTFDCQTLFTNHKRAEPVAGFADDAEELGTLNGFWPVDCLLAECGMGLVRRSRFITISYVYRAGSGLGQLGIKVQSFCTLVSTVLIVVSSALRESVYIIPKGMSSSDKRFSAASRSNCNS